MPINAAKFRILLEQHKEDLLKLSSIAEEARQPVELDQQSIGRLSRQDALQQQAMAQAQEKLRQRDLRRINQALDRLEIGEYGFCLECEEEILEKRLEIDLMAELCLNCKTN